MLQIPNPNLNFNPGNNVVQGQNFVGNPQIQHLGQGQNFVGNPQIQHQGQGQNFIGNPQITPQGQGQNFVGNPQIQPQGQGQNFANNPQIRPQGQNPNFNINPIRAQSPPRLNVAAFNNEIQVNDVNGDRIIISGVNPSDVTITQIPNPNVQNPNVQNQRPQGPILNDPLSAKKVNIFKSAELKADFKALKSDIKSIGSSCKKKKAEDACSKKKEEGSCGKKKESCGSSTLYFWIFLWSAIIVIMISMFAGYDGCMNWLDDLNTCGLVINKWLGCVMFILTQFISSFVAYRAISKCSGASKGINIAFYTLQAIFSILWVYVLFGCRNIKCAIVFAFLYLITIIAWMIYLCRIDAAGTGLLVINLLWGIYIVLATCQLARLNECF
jgi:tryptophan-rich sensory protein